VSNPEKPVKLKTERTEFVDGLDTSFGFVLP
jgi:hypothetical protein